MCSTNGSATAGATGPNRSSATNGRPRRWKKSSQTVGSLNTTEDLLHLLNVLGRLVAIEPRQADLLDRIVAGALVPIAGKEGEQESGITGNEPSP